MRNLEDLIVDLGGLGLSQFMIIVLVNLLRACSGWTMLTMSFANFVPKWCCLPDNHTATSGQFCREDEDGQGSDFGKRCSLNTTECSHRVFASGVLTVVNEWDLVCERKWMVPLTLSVQMAGVMFGAFLAGQMIDLIGRKKCAYLNSACGAVFNIIAGFSINWEMFVALRFILGVTIGGHITAGIPYTTEFVPSSHRAWVSALPTFSMGGMLLALVSWRVPDWRMVHWIGGAMVIPLLLGYFVIPESLRWLAVQGREKEAQKVVEWVARWNRQIVPKDSLELIKVVASEAKNTRRDKNYTYFHVYKGWYLFKSSVILQYVWCVLSLSAYGFSFSAASLGTNMYLNIFLLSLITFPSFIFFTTLVERLGRRKINVMFFVLSGACCFIALAVKFTVLDMSTQVTAILILSLSSRTLLVTAWSGVTITTNEIYPTVIRGLGYGAANVVARVGAIIAPFAINFEDNPIFTMTLLGVLLITSAIFVFFLDETGGKAMQETTVSIATAPGDKKEEAQHKPLQQHDAIVASISGDGNNVGICHKTLSDTGEEHLERRQKVSFADDDGMKIDNSHAAGTVSFTLTEIGGETVSENTRL